MKLERIHVHLTEQQTKALRAISERTGSPMAWLIRKAVEEYLERQEAVKEMSE